MGGERKGCWYSWRARLEQTTSWCLLFAVVLWGFKVIISCENCWFFHLIISVAFITFECLCFGVKNEPEQSLSFLHWSVGCRSANVEVVSAPCTRLSAQCPLQLSLFWSPAPQGGATVLSHMRAFQKFKGLKFQQDTILPSKNCKKNMEQNPISSDITSPGESLDQNDPSNKKPLE